jgi:superfamily II DNA/RNA helicase
VLSEGQNLQDAGILINYDLHWNPVRMIQRNGRINRLGSEFSEVVIANAKPHSDLELYLRLVRRLERKIDTIKNSIGTDQSVLGETENPIEFIDYYDNDKTKASAAAEAAAGAAEGETDILEFTDEFTFELRKYLAAHQDDGEIERIQSIPKGKWNYLPKNTNADVSDEQIPDLDNQLWEPERCLALERVIGKTSITGEPIVETMFVQIETIGRYRASVIEDADALTLIQTTPEDNARLKDNIKVERQTVARRASRQAIVKAESPDAQYDLKPKQLEALSIMMGYVPAGIDLQNTVRSGIRNARHKREFEKLVRMINREVKEHGSVFSSTISKFEKLINELLSIQGESREIEETENILFYHSRN